MSSIGNFIAPVYTPTGRSGKYDNGIQMLLGQQYDIVWNTTLDTYRVALYHQLLDNGGSGIEAAIVTTYDGDGAGTITYSWTVQSYDTDLVASPVFYFWVNPDGGYDNALPSAYFNITEQAVSSSSLSSTMSITSSTTMSTSTTSSVSSTSPNPDAASSSVSPTPAPSKSNSTAIGLGVGLGVGLFLLLAIGIWFGMRMMKKRRQAPVMSGNRPPSYVEDPQKVSRDEDPQEYISPVMNRAPVHEAP